MGYKIIIKTADYVTPVTQVDVSNFVLSIDSIPFITKNRDYSLITGGYKFILSYTTNMIPTIGSRVFAYRGTKIIHIGIIKKVYYNKNKLEYTVDVGHIFSVLKDKTTKETTTYYASFVDALIAQSENRTVWGSTYKLITVIELIKAIIKEISAWSEISVVWYAVNYFNTKYYQWYGTYRWDSDEQDKYFDELCPVTTYDDVLFLPQQINCCGEPDVHNPSDLLDPSTIETSDSRRITLFDILSLLCSMFGFYFVTKGVNEFYVCNERPYVPGTVGSGTFLTDDDFLSINDEDVTEKNKGIRINYRTLKTTRQLMPGAPFYINPYSSLPIGSPYWDTYTHSDGKNHKDLTWINHINPIVHKEGVSEHIIYPRCKDISDSILWYQGRSWLYSFLTYNRTVISSTFFDINTLYEFEEVTIDVESDEVNLIYSKVIS